MQLVIEFYMALLYIQDGGLSRLQYGQAGFFLLNIHQ